MGAGRGAQLGPRAPSERINAIAAASGGITPSPQAALRLQRALDRVQRSIEPPVDAAVTVLTTDTSAVQAI
jgi:hypothetical protein